MNSFYEYISHMYSFSNLVLVKCSIWIQRTINCFIYEAVQFTQVGSCQSVLLQTYAFYISIKISTAAVTCGFCHFLARQMSQKNIWILAGVRRCATRQLAASVLLPQVESPSYTFQHSMQQKNISIVFAVPGQRERIQNIVYYMS